VYVPIGGIEQWIQFNEDRPDNSTLLYLHGGPGGTSVPFNVRSPRHIHHPIRNSVRVSAVRRLSE
jgi:hypothetical protein